MTKQVVLSLKSYSFCSLTCLTYYAVMHCNVMHFTYQMFDLKRESTISLKFNLLPRQGSAGKSVLNRKLFIHLF